MIVVRVVSSRSRSRSSRVGGATLVSKQLLVLNEDGGGRVENVPSSDSTMTVTTMGNNNNNNIDSKTKDVLTLIEMAVMGLNGHDLYDCIINTRGTAASVAAESSQQLQDDDVDASVIKSGEEGLKPNSHTSSNKNTDTKYRRVAEVLHELGASGGVEIQGLEVPPRAVDAMQVIRNMSGNGNGLGERGVRYIGKNGVKGKGAMIIGDTRNWEMELDDGRKLLL
jgi:hypothetical protein